MATTSQEVDRMKKMAEETRNQIANRPPEIMPNANSKQLTEAANRFRGEAQQLKTEDFLKKGQHDYSTNSSQIEKNKRGPNDL